MCKLSIMEKTVMYNSVNKSPAVMALALGIKVSTIGTYKTRIRRKREAALKLIQETNPHKRWLYKQRRGE